MEKVYLETTIVSYLMSNPSRDLITAGHQAVTRQWWEDQRALFDGFISAVVLDGIQQGDPRMAAKRLESLAGVPVLEINAKIETQLRAICENAG